MKTYNPNNKKDRNMPRKSTTSETTYNGHPLLTNQPGRYAFNTHILNKLDTTFNNMLDKYDKVFFMRMDVRYPKDHESDGSNNDFQKFISSWAKNRRRHGYEPQTLWVREQSKEKHQHYHCVSLMNGHKTQSINSHVAKAEELWAKTLNIPNSQNLINNCTVTRTGEPQQNGIMLRKDDPEMTGKRDDCFRWSSYLAKTNTKANTPKGSRSFGCSITSKQKDQ